jgi:hypothetical protein
MAINLSARQFSLTINGVTRTLNVLNINLSQNELGSEGVFVTGEIELQANYSEVTDFTYLASPSIGENWARGALVVYQVANDSGTLVNHVLSGGALYILKEPAPPNAQFQITLEVGDQAALKNYRSADTDASGIVAGVSTNRDTVITRYLNAATISNSISSIPYPFTFPQPKTEGNSLLDQAAKMARASNHILYTNAAGTVVNKAINLAASPVATYRIGEDEQLFNQVDGSGIETPVDELVISGIKTSIESITYPKTTVNTVFGTIKYTRISPSFSMQLVTARFISKRTTVTDYGWNGAEERVNIFVEGSALPSSASALDNLLTDPAFFLKPVSETIEITRYDNKNRLILKRVENDSFLPVTIFSAINISNISFSYQRVSASDEEKTYSYNDLDVLQSIRTETQQYIPILRVATLQDAFYGKTAKVESWSANTYTIENFYKPATLTFEPLSRTSFLNASPTLTTIEGDWESAGSELVYATDGSTKPPATTYRKPYEPIEEQINATLIARPFAGQSFYSRSRPIEVPFLESQMQATEYGNTYLALLYGRKQGFEFGTALDNTLLSLTPLSRINILWRGVRYDCLTDGLSWSHTQTQMAIGMRLIVLGTALESDPPETVYPAIVASALIEATLSQLAIIECEISALDFVGGTFSQSGFIGCFVQSGIVIEAQFTQSATITANITGEVSGLFTQSATLTLSIASNLPETTLSQNGTITCTVSG